MKRVFSKTKEIKIYHYFKGTSELNSYKRLSEWSKLEKNLETKRINKPDSVHFYRMTITQNVIRFEYICLYAMVTYESEFLKTTQKSFLVINYDTKKVFLKNKNDLFSHSSLPNKKDILKILKIDWFTTKNIYFGAISDKVFSLMLLGKITNQQQLLKKVFFNKIKNAVPQFPMLYDSIINSKLSNSISFSKALKVAISQENFIINLTNLNLLSLNNIQLIDDIINQAFLLRKKINFSWSMRRFNEEHLLMTKQINSIELLNTENIIVDYKTIPIIIDNKDFTFNLLDSTHKMYFEGKYMNHCINGSGYIRKLTRKTHLYFHLFSKKNLEAATIEFDLERLQINQFYGKCNFCPSDFLQELFETHCLPTILSFANKLEGS